MPIDSLRRVPVVDRRAFLKAAGASSAAAVVARTSRSNWANDAEQAGGVENREKYLVLDSRLVERVANARLTVGQVTKHLANPLFVADKPWEVRFDNLYANVVYDTRRRLYQCWYNPFIVDDVTSGTPRARRSGIRYRPAHREMGICYARSKDGLTWEKPDLGIVEFNGSAANNLVFRGPHGAGVFLDVHDPNPSRRYKLFARASDRDSALAVAFSPDGLHWTGLTTCPEAAAVADTHNNAFWAPDCRKYVGITRLWRDGQRIVGRTESDAFLAWSKTVEVLRGDGVHQTYAMPVFRYAGVYLGLVMLLNGQDDRVRCELAWSPDTMHWERIDPGRPLIPNSEKKGDYDWGCIYAAAAPVILEDEIRLYYSGSNDTHGAWRDGCLALATLRPDQFAGFEPQRSDQPGTLVTRPVRCTGSQLRVTADTAGGRLRVGVLDADNFTLARCQPITGKVANRVVQWSAAADLESLTGRSIRLKFELQMAKLYAFSFGTSPHSAVRTNGDHPAVRMPQ